VETFYVSLLVAAGLFLTWCSAYIVYKLYRGQF